MKHALNFLMAMSAFVAVGAMAACGSSKETANAGGSGTGTGGSASGTGGSSSGAGGSSSGAGGSASGTGGSTSATCVVANCADPPAIGGGMTITKCCTTAGACGFDWGNGCQSVGGGGDGGAQADAATTVTCGGQDCSVTGQTARFLTACCTTSGACGAQQQGGTCVEQNQQGTAGGGCPDETAFGGYLTGTGCCRPDGRCGIDFAQLPYGCEAREDYQLGQTTYNAMSCGGSTAADSGSPTDAGPG